MIVLVTHDGIPEVHPHDRPLWDALVAEGLDVRFVSWSAPAFDWRLPDLCVIRTTWDYFKRRDEFLAWSRTVRHLWNPPAILEWNSHKGYLAELGRRGLPVVPTEAIRRGSTANLEELAARRGWSNVGAVAKPAVSGGAWRTFIARPGTLQAHQAELDALVRDQDMLVQPYLRHLGEQGEHSLIYLGGELTHAVDRSPGLETPGAPPSRLSRYDALPEERQLAEQAIAAVPPEHHYVRVDLSRDDEGRLVILELEMIEPNLYLHLAPDAAEKFARLIALSSRA